MQCQTKNCLFFGEPYCSQCARKSPDEKKRDLEAPSLTIDHTERELVYYLPIPKEIKTVSQLLQHMAKQSRRAGPGQNSSSQNLYFPSSGKRALSVVDDLDCDGGDSQRIQVVEVREIIQDANEYQRDAYVVLRTWAGDRLKVGWLERSDGTNTVHRC
jgi:hypothetical protein